MVFHATTTSVSCTTGRARSPSRRWGRRQCPHTAVCAPGRWRAHTRARATASRSRLTLDPATSSIARWRRSRALMPIRRSAITTHCWPQSGRDESRRNWGSDVASRVHDPKHGRRMDTVAALKLLGGLGLFLLGIHHLTDGLKSLAGDSLRRALQRLVSGRYSAVAFGALFTAAIQSSSATIFTVIGFVSAGLITFPQGLGINIGATLGTTSTPWLVAIFGFRIRIALVALPILGIGALLWMVGPGRWRSLGAIMAGFGLIFTGIDFLQNGMMGISWDLESFAGTGVAARWVLAAIGVVMTIVM